MRQALWMLVLVASTTNAAPVVWTVDAEFSDGTRLSGYFSYDADTLMYDLDDFSCQFGGDCPTQLATEHSSEYSDCMSFAGISCDNALVNGGKELNLSSGWDHQLGVMDGPDWGKLFISFASELTNAGGVIAIDSGSEWYFNDTGEYLTGRSIVSGQVSAVPVPAAVWLFGSGLGLLGWLRRRQAT